MGAVHGVYLKYVGMSIISFAGYTFMLSESSSDGGAVTSSTTTRSLMTAASQPDFPMWQLGTAAILGYSALINGVIAALFKLEMGMGMIGKDKTTGKIPLWSYIIFFPFHFPSLLYTEIHTRIGKMKVLDETTGKIKKIPVPVASEVQPGWWVGGCYSHELGKDWGGIIDLTVEFPETCFNRSKAYLNVPTWDGVPATPAQLDEAAQFAVEARKNGDVLVHCAHGRGRSTTIMCACLVKQGLYKTWEEAFEKGIKPGRSCCKLNGLMRKALTAWQAEYVDGKKSS
mmetsp:Transcript_19929/g.28823  ORF Transcript_19929/g.28823 Transcript_19929/m.28823 type:complete len:285 (-) Transcript_19929:235-1089(-)